MRETYDEKVIDHQSRINLCLVRSSLHYSSNVHQIGTVDMPRAISHAINHGGKSFQQQLCSVTISMIDVGHGLNSHRTEALRSAGEYKF